MKKVFLIIYLTFTFSDFFSQKTANSFYRKPEYVGGKKEFYKYMDNYFVYPEIEKEKGTKSADLKASIYISKEGKIKSVNVSGEDNEFKDQVQRVLTLMPEWSPALFKGVPIDTVIIQKIWFTYGDSRLKKDSTIYEHRTYEAPLPVIDASKWLAELQEKDKKRKITEDLFSRASIEYYKNNFSEAARLYNEAKTNGMQTSTLYINLALAQLQLNDKPSACTNFKEAARKGDQEAYDLYMKMCK